ncbi:hypothetical protein C8Q79DRAFT_1012670 [Trametes meyenii]|nr:hypothetical protein C8Q79DRAFT_1012670 [Trametes meyenii]
MQYHCFELLWFVWFNFVPGLVYGLPARDLPNDRPPHQELHSYWQAPIQTEGLQDAMSIMASPLFATERTVRSRKDATDALPFAVPSSESPLYRNIGVDGRLNTLPVSVAQGLLRDETSVRQGEHDAFHDGAPPGMPMGNAEPASIQTIRTGDYQFERSAIHQDMSLYVISSRALTIAVPIVLIGLAVGWVCDSFLLHL